MKRILLLSALAATLILGVSLALEPVSFYEAYLRQSTAGQEAEAQASGDSAAMQASGPEETGEAMRHAIENRDEASTRPG